MVALFTLANHVAGCYRGGLGDLDGNVKTVDSTSGTCLVMTVVADVVNMALDEFMPHRPHVASTTGGALIVWRC